MAGIVFDDNVPVEKIGDGTWRAYSTALGMAVYADSRDAADAKLGDAAHLLFDVMKSRGGLPRATARLDRAGVNHRIVAEDGEIIRYAETREVAFG